MEIKNKIVLITGSKRIGVVVALDLAKQGCDVAMTYRDSRKEASKVQKQIQSLGRRAMVYKTDVTKEQELIRLVEKVQSQMGGVDILVNMASSFEKTPIDVLLKETRKPRMKTASWKKNMETDLESVYRLSLLVFPSMKKRGGGRIINFTDWVAVSDRPRYKGYLPYYVAKTGIKGLTESLALELAPTVLVNAIAPGPILPPAGKSKKEQLEAMRSTPLKRWGGAEEISKAVLFLVQSNFVNGECLRVDGGRHLV